MSSTYYLLCMSHDPAVTITELGDPESLPKPDDLEQTHPNCDFLITRHSGALIEVGCPGFGNRPCKWHTGGIQWVKADWLRLLALLTDDEPLGVRTLREQRTLQCWDIERIHRLRYELEGER